METIRLTTAQAIVRFLASQRIRIGEDVEPLFPGVFAIFGHGNVTCLGEALFAAGDRLPTWRGQNEQSMAMAAVAFAKARRRRQVMVATSSIGPGALNMVTAAGIAMANRLPLLLLGGDTFVSRIPDPVLQQVEHFGSPSITVNDAFRAVCRYWDRITHPAQVISSLPQATAMLLDPGECGPAFIGLPQDVQAEAFDYPADFFRVRAWSVRRPGPDPVELEQVAGILASARSPLVIAGGGVLYSEAEDTLRRFCESRRLPVAETVAGKSALPWDHSNLVGPIGVTGSTSANEVAAGADVVLTVGTRLQDFTTGSWSIFQHDRLRIVSVNTARFDAVKHATAGIVADARRGLEELDRHLGTWAAPDGWLEGARRRYADWNRYLDSAALPPEDGGLPSYQAVVRTVWDHAKGSDYVLAAAGGLPGELNKGWRSLSTQSFDCEYGFSCMGYEIGGAWGAAMALPDRTVISFCGDGSYLMANSEIYSSVLAGHKFIVVLCDNGGFAVIDRLQTFKGSPSFNNLIADTRHSDLRFVDFQSHARSLGAWSEMVDRLEDLPAALDRARRADRTAVLVIRTDPHLWTGGDAWWDVGVPEVSAREDVLAARAAHEAERKGQRLA